MLSQAYTQPTTAQMIERSLSNRLNRVMNVPQLFNWLMFVIYKMVENQSIWKRVFSTTGKAKNNEVPCQQKSPKLRRSYRG